MKRNIICILALCAIGTIGAFAQTTDTFPTFAIENGYDVAYLVESGNAGTSYRLGIMYGLTDKLQAEFSFMAGDGGNYSKRSMLGFNYAILSKVGVSLFVGSDGTIPLSGTGIWATVFGKNVQGSLQTGLRLRLDYIAPTTDFSKGMVRVCMAAVMGM